VVSVGGTSTRVRSFRDARSVVDEAITNLMARDPESVARHATAVDLYFETGAAEHMLIAHGSWSATVTVDGEPVPLAITRKRRWWQALALVRRAVPFRLARAHVATPRLACRLHWAQMPGARLW
jgi:hypothetical protein